MLIEKLPSLGGTSTAVLDTFYGFYLPGSQPRKVVGGIADEVVAGLRGLGPVVTRPNTFGAGTGVTYLPAHLEVVWGNLIEAAGARPLLHAFVQAATVQDGRVVEVVVATKAGLGRVVGSVFIDASGDADLCHHAGFGYERAADSGDAQTLTTTFRMANVDLDRRATRRPRGDRGVDAGRCGDRHPRAAAPRWIGPSDPRGGHDGDDHDSPGFVRAGSRRRHRRH